MGDRGDRGGYDRRGGFDRDGGRGGFDRDGGRGGFDRPSGPPTGERPRLQLKARTAAPKPDISTKETPKPKANPFGGAAPVDTKEKTEEKKPEETPAAETTNEEPKLT